MKIAIYIVIILSMVFTSCSENHTYSFENKISNNTWKFLDPVAFSPEIDDNGAYDIALQIDYGEFYAFENIYLRITDNFTGKLHSDTIGFNLSNKYGFWNGKKSGDFYSSNLLLRKSFIFPSNGKYNFKVEQFTREDSLKEINSVKLFVDKVVK